MWIESLDIDDFGHFDRARLDGLTDGLTVIGGPQRAGKTTFMEAIRYLGYGLTNGAPVPPATDRYDVTATLNKDGYKYEVVLDGYATPRVTELDDAAPEISARELFGGMRKLQYQQLYTVSLDELDRHPERLGDDVELSTVLLEAASGVNITDVPDVRDEFAATAADIGGKHGRKSYDLRDPLETIEDGIDKRDEAIAQVDAHDSKAAQKAKLEDRIAEIDEAIAALETERTCLDAVDSAHESYRALQDYDAELEAIDLEDIDRFPVERLDDARALAQDIRTARQDYRKAVQSFESKVGTADIDEYREQLLDHRGAIEGFERDLSGFQQRVETLEETKGELERRRHALERRAENIGPDWGEDPLETVRSLDTDLFTRDAVETAVERYQSLADDIASLRSSIQDRKTRRTDLQDRIEAAEAAHADRSPGKQLPIVIGGSIVALLAGGIIGLTIGPLAGVVVTLLVMIVTGAVAYSRLEPTTADGGSVAVDTLRAELEKVETELDAKRDRIDQLTEQLEAAETTLDQIRDTYDLPDDVSADGIARFYDELVELSDRVATFDEDTRRHASRIRAFRSDLAPVVETLETVGALASADVEPESLADTPSEADSSSGDDAVFDASAVFSAIELAVAHLDVATDVQIAEERVRDLERDSKAILDSWDEMADTEWGPLDVVAAIDQFIEHGERVEEYRSLRQERNEARHRLRTQLGLAAYRDAFETLRDHEPYDDYDWPLDTSEIEGKSATARERSNDEADTGQEPSRSDDWLIDAFEIVFESHGSLAAVRQRQAACEARIRELTQEQKECRERRTDLERELADLAADDDVRAAHELIERGQRKLEPLAEEYAINRIGEYLLEVLHERFIERTTGPLLAEASDIFQRITGDEYTGIGTRDEFDDLDFEAVLANGGVQTTGELSRGTAEQLFLSVRLARIKRYPEPLPVLLDDSLTNFDPDHAQRTVDVVSELAAETQVFLLTCHPTLVERVGDTDDAQFWCLEDATFEGPYETSDPVRELFPES